MKLSGDQYYRMRDRVRGCLIGGAIGDALGYAVEFESEKYIFNAYGQDGITEYDLVDGKALISDDTQMTLFTATGVLQGQTRGCTRGIMGSPSSYVALAYTDWLRTQMTPNKEVAETDGKHTYSWLLDVPELFSQRAPGMTCLSALSKEMKSGRDFITTVSNNSKGCGGVMRVAPLALLYKRCDEYIDMEAAQIAAITHGHSLGYMPAMVVNHIISLILLHHNDMSLKEMIIDARDTAKKLFAEDKHIDELIDIIDLAIELSENDDTDLNNIHKLGEGWVAEETLAIAIYCSLKYQGDFSKAIITAVNHNGDSDSTGAVTGNILGTLVGYRTMDNKWKTNLELKEVIIEIADDLAQECQVYGNMFGREDMPWVSKYLYGHRYVDEEELNEWRKRRR